MHSRKPKDVQPLFPGDLAEVEQQIKLWSSKAADLGPNIVAFALALSADASHILFKGDSIVFDAPAGRGSDVALPTLDLAAIRNIVCNLKILQTEREKLEARENRYKHEVTSLEIISAAASRSNEGPSRG
jgi:hypothetical protein